MTKLVRQGPNACLHLIKQTVSIIALCLKNIASKYDIRSFVQLQSTLENRSIFPGYEWKHLFLYDETGRFTDVNSSRTDDNLNSR